MICVRFDLKRDLVRYVDGELGTARVARVEAHLVDCASCRETVVALRDGRAFARAIEPVPARTNGWSALEAAMASGVTPRAARPKLVVPRLVPRLSALALTGWTVAAAALAVNVWFVIGPRVMRALDRHEVAVESGPVDLDGFQTVSVRDIQANTKPHIVAEGKVAEVRYDAEDGDLMFKLVDELDAQDHFIICEVIDPIRIAPPPVGSKVRVYGVSRFDPEEDHNWFEIHPVLSIEQLAH